MPVKIRVQNFQSISDAELTVDRFTVVTGSNNLGKSAVIRAVRGCFANTGGDSFVRHGTDKLSVSVSLDDGQEIVWEKGPKIKPSYKINGKLFHPGREKPEEVAALGVRPIQIGGLTLWPQIASQFTGQLFLVDQTGSVMAEAVADVERVSRLTQALRLAETDKRASASELKVRRADLQQLQEEAKRLAGVPDVLVTVKTLQESRVSLQREEDFFNQIRKHADLLHKTRTQVSVLSGIRRVSLPPKECVGQIQPLLNDMIGIRQRFRAATQVTERLSPTRKLGIPAVPDRKIGETLALVGRLQKRLVSERLRAEKARAALTGIQPVVLNPKTESLGKTGLILTNLRTRLLSGKKEISTLRAVLQQKQKELLEAEQESKQLLETLGVCPTCLSTVCKDHMSGVRQ
jgi:hypothetical protein